MVLVHESKEGMHQKMRQNVLKGMEQTGMVGGAYTRRSWRNTEVSARALVRNGGGLVAWGGAGSRGNGRGCRGPFIGAEKEGNWAIMAGIKSSPE